MDSIMQPLIFDSALPIKLPFGAYFRGKRRLVMTLLVTISILTFFLLAKARPYDRQSLDNFINLLDNQSNSNGSTCSLAATERGAHQNVISFSFYGSISHERDYFPGIAVNAELMIKLYPNWVMRVYHDISDTKKNHTLKKLKEKYGNVLDFCFVGNLPVYGNLLGAQQNMWRFLTLSDPLVDVTIFRDLDSNLSEREVAAVIEWLSSPYPMHVMRDNPFHDMPMQAGMWGAKLADYRSTWSGVLHNMLIAGREAGDKGLDQTALANHVWTLAETGGMVMQHDSYFCTSKNFSAAGGMHPFPTCRMATKGLNYVGSRRTIDKGPMTKTCPIECRIEETCDLC